LAARIPDRLGRRNSGLVFELFEHAGVLLGEGGDAVPSLVDDERLRPSTRRG
jgi:hypothetical protein